MVGIGYTSSIQKAIEIIMMSIKDGERILSDPAPQIVLSELADSRVSFVVRPWVKKVDYWPLRFEIAQKIKEAFDKNRIETPFPQRAVHMISKTE